MTTQFKRVPTADRAPAAARVAGLTAALESLAEADGQLRRQAGARAAAPEPVAWERRYQALFEALPDACFLTDGAGIIREANPAASGLIGSARKYCLGKPLTAYVLPEDAPAAREVLARAATLAEGKTLTWQGRVKPSRHNDLTWVSVRVAAIRDQDGALAGFSWLVRDVTAQRHIEEQYRSLVTEQDARLRARTAELEAIVKVQAALIAHDHAGRS